MSFEDDDGWECHKHYHLLTVKIKGYAVMIDGRNFFDQPIKNNLKTHDNIRKISIFQVDDYRTDCLLDCLYFRKYYKFTGIDLSKQQKLDADLNKIQKYNFTGNIDREESSTMSFITEEAKETFLDFSKEQLNYYDFISL